jgi:hypothetical protein
MLLVLPTFPEFSVGGIALLLNASCAAVLNLKVEAR